MEKLYFVELASNSTPLLGATLLRKAQINLSYEHKVRGAMAAKKKQSSKTDEQRSQASPEEWPLTADSNREILATAGIGASVSEVEVVLRHDPGMISLSITDNRKGFEVHENTSLPTRSEGIGLIGIHERLELLGGRLEIDFAPGEAHR